MVKVVIRRKDVAKRVKIVFCKNLGELLGLVLGAGIATYWIDHQQVSRQGAEDHLRIKAN